ncbi:helix-turn-helix domain-containing protein [Paenibacillus sp. HJGM_3]|uniref:helix-turn-helix domain-containing protein n=1 Tax=Paenibacillus sp. HJGM_3 TaxID=3379816 RepID=UPI003858A2AC
MLSWNDQLDSYEHSSAAVLEGYISSLHDVYGVSVNLHDLAGLTRIDDDMGRVLTPYLYHNNPFCNYLKKHEAAFRDCVSSKNVLCRQCSRRDKPFFSKCYMGVEELRYPLYWRQRLLGILCVGLFTSNESEALVHLEKQAGKYKLNPTELKERYLASLASDDLNVRTLTHQVGMLAEYLIRLYEQFLHTQGVPNVERAARAHKENYLLEQALDYIQEHYAEALSLRTIAAHCYCNVSYLSTLFKMKTGTTITDHIHLTRLTEAKRLLDVTTLPVTQIAFRTGYSDSNYFARVFRKYIGKSPLQYRDRRL